MTFFFLLTSRFFQNKIMLNKVILLLVIVLSNTFNLYARSGNLFKHDSFQVVILSLFFETYIRVNKNRIIS